jgi:hypothetical protein
VCVCVCVCVSCFGNDPGDIHTNILDLMDYFSLCLTALALRVVWKGIDTMRKETGRKPHAEASTWVTQGLLLSLRAMFLFLFE